MHEVGSGETREMKNPAMENYGNIKPESGMTKAEADDFLSRDLGSYSEFGGEYNSFDERLKHTPKEDSANGRFEGERGESKFIPSEATEESKAAKEKLAEYGLDGVDYINAEPNFSKCSEATVKIEHMTENRQNYFDKEGKLQKGNFSQADEKCASLWNEQSKDGKSDWTSEDVYNYRHENKLSWHERCDTRTMDLVPREIHDFFKHSGGVSECRTRDAKNVAGGGFDE